jgi:hypothetical protein
MVVAFAAFAGPAFTGSSAAIAAVPLPAHLSAPYFETWTSDAITTIAQQSGARTSRSRSSRPLGKTSCTLAWNGSSSQTVAAGRYLTDIQSLRGLGGDVIPSFGGWSADQGGTEIGDSCKDPAAIASAYEQVVTSYDVTRLDMDIEGRSLTRSAGSTGATRPSSSSRIGRPDMVAPCRSSTCFPRRRMGSNPAGSPCCRTPSRTASGSTS